MPQSIIDNVLERSEGVFLYLREVCNELREGRLSLERLDEFPKGMGGRYWQFFRREFSDLRNYRREIRPVLEIVLAAREPIRIEMLEYLLGDLLGGRYPHELTDQLGSLFLDADRLTPFHKSLTDWLAGSVGGDYQVKPVRGEGQLADKGMAAVRMSVLTADAYFIRHLPSHLASLGRHDELMDLLLNFDWIRRKLDLSGIFALREDCQLARVRGSNGSIEHCVRKDTGYETLNRLPGNGYVQKSLNMTPDGRLCVAAAHSEISVWNLDPGMPAPATMGRKGTYDRVFVLGDDRWLAEIDDETIRLREFVSPERASAFPVPLPQAKALGKRNAGQEVLFGAEGELCVWSVAKRKMTQRIRAPLVGPVVAVSNDLTRALSVVADEEGLAVWETGSGKVLSRINDAFAGGAGTQCLDARGELVIASDSGYRISAWDANSGVRIGLMEGHDDCIDTIDTWSVPGGTRIVSGSRDTTVRVWDPCQSRALMTLTGHSYTVGTVLAMPGERVLSCGGDTVRIWDLPRLKCEAVFTADASVFECDCSTDGKYVAAGDLAGQIHRLEYVPG